MLIVDKFLYGLTVDPPTSSVFTNHNITLKCNITEVGGTLTWEFNYGPLPNNTIISGDNMMTSYLTIIGANDIDNKGRYTCSVKVNTSTLTTSADAIVHVEGINGWMDGWIDRWMDDGQTYRWMDGWMDG